MSECESCGAVIDGKYRLCYDCFLLEKENEARRMRLEGKIPPKPDYTPPTAVCAPKAQESSYTTRQEAIKEAHEENIIAYTELTKAVLELAYQVKRLAGKGADR